MKKASAKKRGSVTKGFVTGLKKTKNFVVENRGKLGKLLLMLAALAALSAAALLILYALDIVYFEDGLQINMHLFDKFQNSWYGWMIVIAVQL